MDLSPAAEKELFSINRKEWLDEADEIRRYFALFGGRLPEELAHEVEELQKRLST
jgi:phosphoenolpyruvate carboxykinase (GTP)